MTERLALLAALAAIGRMALPATIRFLLRHRLTATNYAGDVIPTGTGALLAVLAASLYGSAAALHAIGLVSADTLRSVETEMAAYMLVFAVGWTDDLIGDRSVKGFGGHWRSFRETGTLSTGALKAAGVGLAALWIVRGGTVWWEAAVDWTTIVLSANALNLLDVRPGRAWKTFYAGAALLAIADPAWSRSVWLLPGAAGGAALFSGDLKGKHMLGDSGANLLGFSLGCSIAGAAPWWLQTGALIVLAAMHRTAETGSITAWIERHKWLRWFDRLGRA